MQNMLPLIFALLGLAAVLYLSYLFSRYLAVGAAKISKSKYIKVIDRVVLGQDKMILIVRIGEKNYLVGSSTQSIHILAELPSLPEDSPKAGNPAENSGFQAALQSLLSRSEK